MKDYAKKFYNSQAWKKCRKEYAASVGGLCERCLKNGLIKPGEIVHHKIYLSPENIDDPTVTLNFDNLKLLCRDCHALEHEVTKKRYIVDDNGHVIIKNMNE